MNRIIRSTVVTLSLTLADGAIVADENNRQDAKELTPSVHISVVNQSNHDKVAEALKAKTEQSDVSYLRIT